MNHRAQILSHHGHRIKVARPRDLEGFAQGFVLQQYSERGLGEIEVDRREMLALLRTLPVDVLQEAQRGREVPQDTNGQHVDVIV